MTYKEAVEYLYSRLPMFSRVGAAAYKPGLERVIVLASYFNNPQNQFPSVHIAGTNGKGSTSHIIASSLMAAGYKTGLYTSPHLVDFRERIRINGELIPEKYVIDFVQRWIETDYGGEAPSFFELTMIMAFDWFALNKVDIAVIETGMGGRLDSTNILTPLLSVITNISYDHTQFLGHTLTDIAREKAGIIKPGIPVVVGEAEQEVRTIFKSKGKEMNSPVLFADSQPCIKEFTLADDYSGWFCKGTPVGDFFVDLSGDYQQKNVNTALHALLILRNRYFELSDKAIQHGMAHAASSTGLKGRWMIISHNPLTICDTAHNEGGLEYVVKRLNKLKNENSNSKLRILLGFVADKDVDKILKLFPADAVYYITRANIPRAMSVSVLASKCSDNGLLFKTFEDVFSAYQAICQEASDDDIVYVGGSTFIVADFLATCLE